MIRVKFRVIIPLTAVIAMLSAVSCDITKKYEKEEKEQIEEYLSKNSNLNFVKQQSGLYYLEVVTGTGISPEMQDSAYVKFTGMFLDGILFDSSVITGKLYGCLVYRNISGFSEGLTLMKQGGKSTLLIPSNLGYGSMGKGDISAYTPLLFDIELIKVVKYSVNWDY